MKHLGKQGRGIKFYIHPEREPLLINSKPNETLLKKLILGWISVATLSELHCGSLKEKGDFLEKML